MSTRNNITIALALGGETEARLYGTITHDLHALDDVRWEMIGFCAPDAIQVDRGRWWWIVSDRS